MPNPACNRIEADYCVKPGWKGSPESEYTRQDGELGNWVERMTNRNQSVKHPAFNNNESPTCVNGLCMVEELLVLLVLPMAGNVYLWILPIIRNVCPCQQRFSMPTGQRDRMGDRLASDPTFVLNSKPGNLYYRPQLRLGQPASDVIIQGRRSRSSLRTGKPFAWRRTPAWTLFSVKITKHDMRNHHA